MKLVVELEFDTVSQWYHYLSVLTHSTLLSLVLQNDLVSLIRKGFINGSHRIFGGAEENHSRSISRVDYWSHNPKQLDKVACTVWKHSWLGMRNKSCQLQSHSTFATINKLLKPEAAEIAERSRILLPLSHFTLLKWRSHVVSLSG